MAFMTAYLLACNAKQSRVDKTPSKALRSYAEGMVSDAQTIEAAHDYARLSKRWRRVARGLGCPLQVFAEADGDPIYVLEHRVHEHRCIYISAGIHGDEPAGVEALVHFVESNIDWLSQRSWIFFPCLNPWGLRFNSRLDQRGRDLNRVYHKPQRTLVQKQITFLKNKPIDLALTLHEDYDAGGFYFYEVIRSSLRPWSAPLIEAGSQYLEPDGRHRIDGNRAQGGVIRRKVKPGEFSWLPEAVWLVVHGARRVFTFETPSEREFQNRVQTQLALITTALCLWEEEATG